MIVKRNFNLIKVIQYVKREMLLSILATATVYWLHTEKIINAALPFSIIAILGSALAIFIAFRNNNAYGRWWEARTLWGGIINSSRVLGRLVITFTDSHAHQSNYDKKRSETFKKDILYKTIAWAHALRLHLRRERNWDELKPLMPADEFHLLEKYDNKPNFIQMLIGKKIYEAMANGTLAGFDSFQMEGQLLALANYQGACERIKNTPLLRQYDYFTRIFLYTFITLLPLSLIGDFMKMELSYPMMPVSIIISFVFAIIGKVGEVNEDPFENRITDVPLSALCNTIERDLKEMLGEKELPEKLKILNGYLH